MHTVNSNPRLFSFIGGNAGVWRVTRTSTITGEGLPEINALDIVSGNAEDKRPDAKWLLQGVTSNERYVTRVEKESLMAKQQGPGRPDSNCGVLIPLRKSVAWWTLTQDERRSVFEDESRHIAIGLKYLPAIVRRLHHCRDLPESQAFDFLTWFEFADEHTELFDQLLERLRASEEWHLWTEKSSSGCVVTCPLRQSEANFSHVRVSCRSLISVGLCFPISQRILL